MSFALLKKSSKSKARLGQMKTPHGVVDTPSFLPIATLGSVKSLDSADLNNLDAGIVLGNTYHLYLQPGKKVIERAGGIHKFMNWNKPILTDSGGYQVFSLAKIRKIIKEGVIFNSHIDGSEHVITPELSVDFQVNVLKSDIIMSFDECPAYPSTKEYHKKAIRLTNDWAKRGKIVFKKSTKSKKKRPLVFGIIQGGTHKDLRIKHTKEIVAIGFNGYALGGLAVGEPVEKMYRAVEWCAPYLPEDKPRYLMGTGYPEQLVESVKRGMDMFDCVIPTREARHGRLYLWSPSYKKGVFKKGFYKTIDITKAKFKNDVSPINDNNLKSYSKAYLHHLFKAREPLSIRLATLNNLHFYLTLMENIRYSIRQNIL